jgi:RimJ/RimL family protein N-acetyltransferase
VYNEYMNSRYTASNHFEAVPVPVIETPSLYLRNMSLGPGKTAEAVLSDPEVVGQHQAIADYMTGYWAQRYELEPSEETQYRSLLRRPESMFPLINIAQKFKSYEQKLRETDNKLPVQDRVATVHDIHSSVEQFFRPIAHADPQELLVMMNHYYLVNKYCDLAEDIAQMTRSDTSKLWDVVMRPEVMDNYVDTDGTQYVSLPQQLSDGGNYWTIERTAALISSNLESWHTKKYGRWAVIERATAQLIGMAGINTFDWLPSITGDDNEPIEISFRLHPDWHQRGYGTEAGRAVTEWLFNVRGGFDYMYGNAVHDNEPSIRTLARVGTSKLVTVSYARPRTRRTAKGSEVETQFTVHGLSSDDWNASIAKHGSSILSIDGIPYTG